MNKLALVLIIQVFIASCTNSTSETNNKSAATNSPVNNVANTQLEDRLAQKLVVDSILDGGSKEDNYNKAISMIQNDEREKGLVILQSFVDNYPDYQSAKSMLDRLEFPFALAASKVENYIKEWIARPGQVAVLSTPKPVMRNIPKNPVLRKEESETTKEFNLRVLRTNEEYQQRVDLLTTNYLRDVEAYDKAIGDYNSQIDWERKSRIEKAPAMRKRLLDIAFEEALGNPVFKNLEYDANKEIFYGQIESEYKNLVLNI